MGTFPECGFSVVMAEEYSKKNITLGTLIAVFISTSDEAIPILLLCPDKHLNLLILIGVKFFTAICFGFVVDGVVGLVNKKRIKIQQHKIIDDNKERQEKLNEGESISCCHNEKLKCGCNACCADNVFLEALVKTLKIVVFLMIASFIVNVIIFYIGNENLENWLVSTSYFQPFLASLIGLIPSCEASVILTELYIEGGITFASYASGLMAGCGVGAIALFRKNKKVWQNVLIIVLVYLIGTGVGCVISLF